MSIRTLFIQRTKAQSAEIDWDAVYEEQLPRLYNYFRYLLGDESLAEELTAATFERAWRKRKQFRHDLGAVSTWLFGIARHLAIDYYRRPGEELPLEAACHLDAGYSVEDAIEQRDQFTRLRALLAQLSERERELVALKYGSGHTNRQIARLTNLSETNVSSILFRVVQKLRAQWEIE